MNLATTFNGGFSLGRFAARAALISVPERLDILPTPSLSLYEQFSLLLKVLSYGLKSRVLLLFRSCGRLKPEVLGCALLGLLPRRFRPVIVLYGEMWEPSQGIRFHLEKWVVRLADRAIHRYFVFSSFEVETFPDLWRVAADKMRLGLFYTLSAHLGIEISPTQHHKLIFAGGNSFRDYEPMIEAARRMPDYEFMIGSHRLARRTDLPPNLRAEQFSLDEFQRLIETAAIVIVPICQNMHRTAGQLTYLEAMWLKKPVIVSNAPGTRDYIEHKKSGFIVDNDDVNTYLARFAGCWTPPTRFRWNKFAKWRSSYLLLENRWRYWR